MGWTIFRSENILASFRYILDMFGLRFVGLIEKGDIFLLREYGLIILMGIIFSMPVLKKDIEKIRGKNIAIDSMVDALVFLGSIALFFVGLSYLAISSHNPFIYFNF